MQGLQNAAAPAARRLLRVLLLRFGQVSVSSSASCLLQLTIICRAVTAALAAFFRGTSFISAKEDLVNKLITPAIFFIFALISAGAAAEIRTATLAVSGMT